MKTTEVQKLAHLRDFIIKEYNTLEKTSPGTSVTKTSDVAYFCESLVASIDDLLKGHVKFSEK